MTSDTLRPLGLLVKMFPKLSETFVLEEVLGLERLGQPLRLYTMAPPSDAVSHGAAARVRAPLTAVPAAPWRTAPGTTAARHLHWLASAPVRYVRALGFALRRGRGGLAAFARAGWLAGQLRADGVAHLHAHFIAQPADLAEMVWRLAGLPFSISAHAKDIYLSEPADLARKLRAARFTVTCTGANCTVLRQLAPEATVQRMYHGVDRDVFHPSRRLAPALVPHLLSVGRLREKKGLDDLIEACRLLRDRGQPFHCEIVGYGEQESALRALIDHHGLADQVELAGKLPRERVIERYARCAVYVQPSRVAADGDRDGIPNVLLEAMAMGVPVVACAVSGIPELVRHGRTGLLVAADPPAAVPEALATAITRLLDDPALARRLGHDAREHVSRHFDNDRNLRLLLAHLHRCEDDVHAPRPSALA